MAIRVFCYPADRDSNYVPLLFAGIEDRYRPVYRQDGPPATAIAEARAGARVVLHVHWEEFLLRDVDGDEAADGAVRAFAADLAALAALDCPIVWTIHNEWPHEIAFRRQFLALRALLAGRADLILVHNTASVAVLAGQVALDLATVRLLPHPSYVGWLEDEAVLRAGLGDPPDPVVQGFGWIRRQKGFGAMIGMLPRDFLAERNLRIRISGEGGDAAAVVAQHPARSDVEWDIRHVPAPAVPCLLRRAACVVLPYERVLTSGVALLALSVGAMLVAVDIPQLRELLPVASQRFLYARDDGRALRAAIDAVLRLTPDERRRILLDNLATACRHRPGETARRLAGFYDALLRRAVIP